MCNRICRNMFLFHIFVWWFYSLFNIVFFTEPSHVDIAFQWTKGSLLINVVVNMDSKYIVQLIDQTSNAYTIQFMGTKVAF